MGLASWVLPKPCMSDLRDCIGALLSVPAVFSSLNGILSPRGEYGRPPEEGPLWPLVPALLSKFPCWPLLFTKIGFDNFCSGLCPFGLLMT